MCRKVNRRSQKLTYIKHGGKPIKYLGYSVVNLVPMFKQKTVRNGTCFRTMQCAAEQNNKNHDVSLHLR